MLGFHAIPRIGIDESGKGDYFGPLVVAAAFLSPDREADLNLLQVRDSKRISDSRILEMAGHIRLICPHRVVAIGPWAGYERTMRYSPGYGDWDLTVQAELLRLVGAEAISVTCTETSILQPRKSVTAVIGWERKA